MPRAPWRSQENDPPILKPTGPGLAMARSLGDHVCKRVGGHAERSVWGASYSLPQPAPRGIAGLWVALHTPGLSPSVARVQPQGAVPKLGRSWAEAARLPYPARIRHAGGRHSHASGPILRRHPRGCADRDRFRRRLGVHLQRGGHRNCLQARQRAAGLRRVAGPLRRPGSVTARQPGLFLRVQWGAGPLQALERSPSRPDVCEGLR